MFFSRAALASVKIFFLAVFCAVGTALLSATPAVQGACGRGLPQTMVVAAPLPAGITEGDLIRGPDGIKVWIVNQYGFKRHIFNPAVFGMYGHFRWDNIKSVDQATLDTLATSDLYRAEGDYRVFSLEEVDEAQGIARKRWLALSAREYIDAGFSWDQIFVINAIERDYYQEGTPLRADDIPAAFEIGIEAGAQFDTSRVPEVVASGAKWVRLNFIVREEWSGTVDPAFVSTYNAIIDAYRNSGIKIIGLIGAESVKGGYDRNRPGDFTAPYVAAADAIVSQFGDRVKVFELFNEPNDWAGGTIAQVPPRYFAEYMEEIWRKIKMERGRNDIHINSGPVFTHDNDTGAEYLAATYEAGTQELGWEEVRVLTGNYPLDGVGYHVYVAQGSREQQEVESYLSANISAIKAVIDERDPGKKLWITEAGWTVAGVGEDGQAKNLTTAFNYFSRQNGFVRMAMWFTLFDFPGGAGLEEWGLLRTDGSRKPAWDAFTVFAQ